MKKKEMFFFDKSKDFKFFLIMLFHRNNKNHSFKNIRRLNNGSV